MREISPNGRDPSRKEMTEADWKLLGGIYGNQGIAGTPDLLKAYSAIEDASLRDVLLEGFAEQAAMVDLEATEYNHMPPFYPEEIAILEAQAKTNLNFIRDLLQRREDFERASKP